MSETKLPGIQAHHRIITPACLLNRSTRVVQLEALDTLEKALIDVMAVAVNKNAKFHLVLTVERPP